MPDITMYVNLMDTDVMYRNSTGTDLISLYATDIECSRILLAQIH